MSTFNNDILMDDLKLHFGTPNHKIDANTFINSVIHFSNIVHAVNNGLNTNRKIEVKIDAFQPGSFVVNIVLESGLIEKIGSLFNKENLDIASNLVGVIGGVFGAAKFLKGEKPTAIENPGSGGIKVTNVEGNVTIIDNRVYNIYSEPVVQEALAKEFETLDNDPEVQSFEITNKVDSSLVKIDRTEFSDISNLKYSKTELTQTVIRTVVLSIISLSFDKKKKWEFLYDGNVIKCKINDDVFHDHIEVGEAFSKGDTLKATLEIVQVFNDSVSAYVNQNYTVTKIHEHTKPNKQSKLSFSDDDIF